MNSRDGPFRPQYTFLVAGGAFHAGTSPALVFSFILGQWVKKFAVLIHLGSTVTEGNSTTFKDKEWNWFCKIIFATLGDNFRLMQKEFNLSQSLKLHTILDQNVEHFELTGETLLKYSDEVCKAMHLQYRIFDFEHRYVDNNKNSDTHLEMQQKSMVHFNSLNLGDVWIYCEIHLN